MQPVERRSRVSVERHLDVQQQLFYEARLLDEERYQEWLALLAEEMRYWLPMTDRRFRGDRSDPYPYGAGSIFDDNKQRLALRVSRLESGYLWAENPRNRVRRVVSNVEVYQGAADEEVVVHSVVQIHRSRMDGMEKHLVAAREDLWRDVDDRWLLAARRIDIDHSVVKDSNLNVFF